MAREQSECSVLAIGLSVSPIYLLHVGVAKRLDEWMRKWRRWPQISTGRSRYIAESYDNKSCQ